VSSVEGENQYRLVPTPTLPTRPSTLFAEPKPQQTGTGLLNRLGEVATTSGSTI